MAIPLTINGVVYNYPEVDDTEWGPEATDWAAAVTNGLLQKSGGLFQLLAEVDFGTGFGVKALYFKTRTANPATAGQFRLARPDVISWRNQANDGNLDLGVNASNQLTFNGTSVQNTLSVTDTTTIDLTLASDVLSADIIAGSITNAQISNSAAIAYSKLALTGAIVNADLANMAQSTIKGRAAGAGTGVPVDLSATQATALLSAFVGDSGAGGTKGLTPAPAAGDTAANKFLFADGTWKTPPGAGDVVGPASATSGTIARFGNSTGKLLSNTPSTISNSDIDNAAAIAYSKLTLTGSIVNADVSASAAIAYSKLALTASIVNADINASAAIAYSKLNLTGAIVNADIGAAAAIAYSKLAALTISRALVSDGSGFVSAATTTSTEIGYVNGVTSAIQTQINTKLPVTVTTTGDMIYSSSGTTASRLGIGTTGQYLRVTGGIPAWTLFTAPTQSTVTGTSHTGGFSANGSGTYTVPAGVTYIRIRMVGGGASGGTPAQDGVDGVDSTFGTAFLVAGKGFGGGGAGGSTGPTGGVATGGDINVFGGYGGTGGSSVLYIGGHGGASYFGGGGPAGKGTVAGGGAIAYGSGGGGGGSSTNDGRQGGSSGAYLEKLVVTPSATYGYAVGSGGASRAGNGSTYSASGAGAGGIIIVDEFYQ